jgi:nucleotide-binding universal stress UspA family protein
MPEITGAAFGRAIASGTDVQLRSVLVATDLTPSSKKAVQYAAALARRYGSKFYLAYVVSSMGYAMVGPDALVAATDLAWRDACAAEAELSRNGTLRGIDHEVIVRAGEIWPELERVVRQKNMDLVVVGTHSRQGLGRLVLGSVAEQIFRHASCPVLTVGPNSPERAETVVSDNLRPILFATDFSDESMAALPYALSFANRRKTRLVLLHMLSAVPHAESNRWYTASDVVRMRKEAEASARQRLLDLVSTTRLEPEPMCIAAVGSAVEGIVDTARSLDAMGIALGLKPHHDAISHLPWSTAYQIVCTADCPVLTVRS